MRAVRVPPGAHAVRFDYRPLSFRLGALVSGLALGALALALRPRKHEGRPLSGDRPSGTTTA
jgi:hypothetical protein